jgi:hypothetical protein
MFQRQFKGQWGVVGWGGKPAMNIVFSVGSMYDSVAKIVVVITTIIHRPGGENNFH